MQGWVDLVLHSGRNAVEIAFFSLLPIMVIMLCWIRLLECFEILDWLIQRMEPLLRWLGITGLGLLAALQMSFVSFAAPLAALSLMEQRRYSQRHLASTLAMVLAMAQANVLLPMAAIGLDVGRTLLYSWLGGFAAAALTYYGLARHMEQPEVCFPINAPSHPRSVLDALQIAGKDALRIATSALPMLVMALLLTTVLQKLGAIQTLFTLLEPLLQGLGIGYDLFVRTLTKYLGGGMALLGIELQAWKDPDFDVRTLNRYAGWLIHSTDLPGLAVLCTAGPRTAAICHIALVGALCGIALRTLLHMMTF